MKTNLFAKSILASFAMGTLLGSSQLMANCVDIKGKIVNSFHSPGLGSIPIPDVGPVGGVSTLGVVSLNAGPLGKMKCALAGVVTEIDNATPPNPTKFEHTISCDDEVEAQGLGIVHSQLTLDTTIDTLEVVEGTPYVLFTETSVPQDGKGLGVFYGVYGGELHVEGSINNYTGSIDMKFSGEVCSPYYP